MVAYTSAIVILIIGIVAVYSAPHDGHVTHCLGHRCEGHHNFCVIKKDHEGHVHGECSDEHRCWEHAHSYCSSSTTIKREPHGPHGEEECCCETQACVNGYQGVDAVYSAPHDGHVTHCLGHRCEGHHNFCVIKKDHEGHVHGECSDEHRCWEHAHSYCSLSTTMKHEPHGPRGEEECCCETQACVNGYQGTNHTQAQLAVHSLHVTQCAKHVCHEAHRSYCLLWTEHHDAKLHGECIDHHQCYEPRVANCTASIASGTVHHGPGLEDEGCCCESQDCVTKYEGHHDQSNVLPFSSKMVCVDKICNEHHHQYCRITLGHHNEVHGECVDDHKCWEHEANACTTHHHHHHHGPGPEGNACCCETIDCVHNYLGITTAAPTAAGASTTTSAPTQNPQQTGAITCPTCSNEADPDVCIQQAKPCSVESKGCNFVLNEHGYTAGCIEFVHQCQVMEKNNSLLCSIKPTPSLALYPGVQCLFCCDGHNTTCIKDALSKNNTPITSTATVPQVTAAPTDVPTTDPNTGITTTALQCVDEESSAFSCNMYTQLYGICTHTSGIGAIIAYQRCPNACNLCGKSLPTSAVPTRRTTSAISILNCVDHDPDNCLRLQNVLCAASDSHTLDYTVANCAKTCNLCTNLIGSSTTSDLISGSVVV